jgi:hypothetical protein
VGIFVLPPNPKVLRTRLRNRSRAEGVMNEDELFRRLGEARKEIENYRHYGYILVNDVLDRAVAQLEAIVLAERFYRNGEPIALPFPPGVGGRRGLPASRTRRSGSNLCWRPSASMATPASSSFPLEMTPMTIETSFDSNYRKVWSRRAARASCRTAPRRWSPRIQQGLPHCAG